MPAFGRRAYLTGSNYIWGWEINRLARETVSAAGGEILGERYLPIGSREIGRIIDEIRFTRPDFILNSLIGPSSYAFLAAIQALGQEDAHFRADRCPVLSCNLTECEFPAIGPAAEGLVAAGPYFRGAAGWPSPQGFGSSHEAAAFAAVRELARLLAGRPGSEHDSLAQLLAAGPGDGAPSAIDAETHHTTLPVLIAQVRDGAFRVIQSRGPVAGDPYLTRGRTAAPHAPGLRVVS
jgi:branched-chain amino acid transport system substrate-binding protein